jgi:hypothetical protein
MPRSMYSWIFVWMNPSYYQFKLERSLIRNLQILRNKIWTSILPTSVKKNKSENPLQTARNTYKYRPFIPTDKNNHNKVVKYYQVPCINKSKQVIQQIGQQYLVK